MNDDKGSRSVPRLKSSGMTIDIHHNSSAVEGCLGDISCYGLRVSSLPSMFSVSESSYSCVVSGKDLRIDLQIQPCWTKHHRTDDFLEAGFEIVDPMSAWKQLFISYLMKHQAKPFLPKKLSSASQISVDRKCELDDTACPFPKELQHILIVEDEVMVATLLEILLTGICKVHVAHNGKQALKLMQSRFYDLVISDYDMPVMNGIDLYKEAVSRHPELEDRFLFTVGGMPEPLQLFLQSNKLDYVLKPIDIDLFRQDVYERIYCLKSDRWPQIPK